MNRQAFLSGYLVKTAGKVWDQAAPMITGSIAGLNPVTAVANGLAQGVGAGVGLLKKAPMDAPADEKDTAGDMSKALIPGVGGHRIGKRMRETIDVSDRENGDKSKAVRNVVGELAGPSLVSPLTLGALGMGAGGLHAGLAGAVPTSPMMTRELIVGGLLGAGAGFGIQGLASLLALARKTRSVEDQLEHDRSSHLVSDMLVPGKGIYDQWKRYGASENFRKKYHKDEKKD